MGVIFRVAKIQFFFFGGGYLKFLISFGVNGKCRA